MSKIHVILCCYNRREMTIRCITSLMQQERNGLELSITLFDDGSTDGTKQSICEKFPMVKVIEGDGDHFWCRSMCAAYEYIKPSLNDSDYLLCINDDIELKQGALEMLIQQQYDARNQEIVGVGVCYNQKNELVYGGLRRTKQIKFELINDFSANADTMNFNCVLIPFRIVSRFGFLDAKFEHSMGDIEYGLRLSKGGVQIVNSPLVAAICEENDLTANFEGKVLFERFQLVISRKYFPFRSWLHFVKKTCGKFWILYFIYPYIRFTLFPSR